MALAGIGHVHQADGHRQWAQYYDQDRGGQASENGCQQWSHLDGGIPGPGDVVRIRS